MPEMIARPAVPLRRQPGHLARRQRPRLHRRADDRAVARARQGRDQGLLRRRQGPRRLHADDPALPDRIRPLEQPEVHHRRKLRHHCAPRACRLAARTPASNSTASPSCRRCFNFADFAGRPVANQLPADLCRGRLVPRQDRRTSRRSKPSSSRRATSRAGPMRWRCRRATRSATRRGSRSRSRWRS